MAPWTRRTAHPKRLRQLRSRRRSWRTIKIQRRTGKAHQTDRRFDLVCSRWSSCSSEADQRSQYLLLTRSKSNLVRTLVSSDVKVSTVDGFKVEKPTSSFTPAFGQTSTMTLGSWTIAGGSMLHGRGPNMRGFSSGTGEHWKEVSYGRGQSRIAMKLFFRNNKQSLAF
jgi:hypothetical protein